MLAIVSSISLFSLISIAKGKGSSSKDFFSKTSKTSETSASPDLVKQSEHNRHQL